MHAACRLDICSCPLILSCEKRTAKFRNVSRGEYLGSKFQTTIQHGCPELWQNMGNGSRGLKIKFLECCNMSKNLFHHGGRVQPTSSKKHNVSNHLAVMKLTQQSCTRTPRSGGWATKNLLRAFLRKTDPALRLVLPSARKSALMHDQLWCREG